MKNSNAIRSSSLMSAATWVSYPGKLTISAIMFHCTALPYSRSTGSLRAVVIHSNQCKRQHSKIDWRRCSEPTH
jgi:hypothetical protein